MKFSYGFEIIKEGRFYKITYDGVSNNGNFLEITSMMKALPNFKVIWFSPILLFNEDLEEIRYIAPKSFNSSFESLYTCKGINDMFKKLTKIVFRQKGFSWLPKNIGDINVGYFEFVVEDVEV